MMKAEDIQTAAVLGAGTMGAGIAQVLAQAGIETKLFDISPDLVQKGMLAIETMLEKGVAKEKITAEVAAEVMSLLSPCSDLDAAVSGVDLVIEAIPEKAALKKQVLQKNAPHLKPNTLYASNTSSLSITDLAEAAPYPDRYLGLHFFNPPPLMKLLEVVHGEKTSPQTIELACDLAKRLGKHPIVVKDAPGFASSRLGLVIGLEAMRMLEEGVASAEDIDAAMTLGYRHPMGPLKLTDLVGLDVRLAIADHLAKELNDQRFSAPQILRDKVSRGELGKKSGQGFYSWGD
jgi:3-hydroxybutyryl-CoA dehydrogenase